MADRKPTPFRAHLAVRFGDMDEAGFVYYPRLVHYFHVAMEEFFAHVLGVDYPTFLAEHRLGLPTAHLEVDFNRPLHYGDHLEIEVAIDRVGKTSIGWRYQIFRPDETEPATEAHIVTVNMDMDALEKKEIPDWLRKQLEDYRGQAGK
jgi:4-hydroxybenzoyl-CoA thioesterase